jgi:hypothetical protein
VFIEIQDKSGNWVVTATMTNPSSEEINIRMKDAAKRYPEKRVRATERVNGRSSVVDIR